VGRGIKASGVKRENIFVTSKLWATHLKPEHAREQIKQILSDLGLDYLDQLLIHWPVAFQHSDETTHPKDAEGNVALDTSVDLLDTWKVLEEFFDAGTLKSIGLSNCTQEQLQRFIDNSKVTIACTMLMHHIISALHTHTRACLHTFTRIPG
jgi:L-glyceraldehyde reductase